MRLIIRVLLLAIAYAGIWPAVADAANCPAGSLGQGGQYSPESQYCVKGATPYLSQKYCEAGRLGKGGFYYTHNNYCLEGATPYPSQKYCEAGRLGKGGFYYTHNTYCLEGATPYLSHKYCEAGRLGNGGFYSTDGWYCIEGVTPDKGEKYCPPGPLGAGGAEGRGTFYRSPYYCFAGIVLSENERYCPGNATRRWTTYMPPDKCPTLDAMTDAGAPLFVSGDVSVIGKDGKVRALTDKDRLAEGDTVATGKDGFLIAALKDQSTVQVVPNSRATIEQSGSDRDKSCDKSNASSCSTSIRLLEGGLRAITGPFTHKRSYRIIAPTMTIGIRGTDFDVLCIKVPNNKDVQSYVRVREGTVYVDSAGNVLEAAKDNVIFVKTRGAAPEIIEEPQGIFAVFR